MLRRLTLTGVWSEPPQQDELGSARRLRACWTPFPPPVPVCARLAPTASHPLLPPVGLGPSLRASKPPPRHWGVCTGCGRCGAWFACMRACMRGRGAVARIQFVAPTSECACGFLSGVSIAPATEVPPGVTHLVRVAHAGSCIWPALPLTMALTAGLLGGACTQPRPNPIRGPLSPPAPIAKAYRNCPGAVGQLVLEPARPSQACVEPPKYTRWHGPSRIT